MKSSPVTVANSWGVAQTPTIHASAGRGYILCVNHAGVSGYPLPLRIVRRSTSLATIVENWFDLGGEGGYTFVCHADGSALSAAELSAAREQLK